MEDHLSLQTKKILQELEKEQMMQSQKSLSHMSIMSGTSSHMLGASKRTGSTPDLTAIPVSFFFLCVDRMLLLR